MSVDIEPLLARITDYAPRFGRARDDLLAIASRGKAGDYRGVLQNARLVVETLLRVMVTEDLKQTPGKATLEELVAKFRQSANAGMIPRNILAHMGTVQAWGNLGSHDHSGALDDDSVRVGQEELVACLNSIVAILGWYAEKKGLVPAGTSVSKPAPPPRTPLIIGASVGVLAGVAAVIFLVVRPSTVVTPDATPTEVKVAEPKPPEPKVEPPKLEPEPKGPEVAAIAAELDAGTPTRPPKVVGKKTTPPKNGTPPKGTNPTGTTNGGIIPDYPSD